MRPGYSRLEVEMKNPFSVLQRVEEEKVDVAGGDNERKEEAKGT